MKNVLSPRNTSRVTPSRRTSLLQNTYKRTPTKLSISGRSNQSVQVLCKTLNHIVEGFGAPLPVLITEALTFADSNTVVSVNISNEGWAWFVCGRRLLVWQASGKRPINTQCRELTLPPSDLAHRAHLVTVYTTQSMMPCCLAVSPEGMVRYWASIAHESSWVEANADLQGQECDCLRLILPLGALLVTTTATLVLVTPHLAAARHSLVCRTIKAPHGWLGGIGRRMSSLIFGSIPSTQIMETKLVKVVTVGESGSSEWNVIILAGHSLQKWQLGTGFMERLIYEADIGRPIRDAFLDSQIEAQDLWLLDMQGTNSGIMLLVAAANSQASTQLHYALVTICTDSPAPPTYVSWFYLLKHQDIISVLQSTHSEKTLQFLLMGQIVLIYNQSQIVAVPALAGGDELEVLDPAGGTILGGVMCGGVPVFFTRQHGFISVSPTDISPYDFSVSTVGECTAVSETGVSESQIEEMSLQKDNVGLMKAAFLLYIRKNMVQSKALVADLFPLDAEPTVRVDALLDTVVVQISVGLIDDIPAQDPRWANHKNTSISIGTSSSLQIARQLEEKQQVLDWYASFLKDLGLWDQLTGVTCNGKVVATTYILQEHLEKAVAATTLRKLHCQENTLIDAVIEEVLLNHDMKPYGGLTNQDLFYCKVSMVHEALQQIVRWSDGVIYTEQSPHQVAVQILFANSVLLEVLNSVLSHRQQLQDMYRTTSAPSDSLVEYLPWTGAPGPCGLRDSLILQMQLTLEHGVRGTGTASTKGELLDQLVNIVDILLDARKCHIESLRNTPQFRTLLQQYEADRLAYIQPLLQEEEYERAAMLAEKYLDFQILVDLCDKTGNKERLNQYSAKFSQQDFSQFLFNWYMREKKQSRLIERCKEKGGEQLAHFLNEHPSLAWLHAITAGNYHKASDTLLELARDETQLLRRKKSMLSLAKLSLLAAGTDSEENNTIEEINANLDLVAHQDELPDAVLNAYGYEFDSLRVFSPSELIKLYVCDENPSCTEFDLKKALDLLYYVEDPVERNELRTEVWCKAITKDTWTDLNANTPMSVLQEYLFFKLVSLCISLDCDHLVPPLDELLTAEEPGPLKENSTFQYLLRVGYEHVLKEQQ